MHPAVRKLIITVATVFAAVAVFLVVANSKRNQPPPAPSAPSAVETSQVESAPETPAASDGEASAPPDEASAPADETLPAIASPEPAKTLSARAPQGGFDAARLPRSIGSLDPRIHPFLIEFASTSAGIRSVLFSEFWRTAAENVQARRHWAAVQRGIESPPPLPSDADRYELVRTELLYQGGRSFEVPVLAVHSIEIDGVAAVLFGNVWSERAPGDFESEIVDEKGTVRYRVRRTFEAAQGSFDLLVRQSVTNLGAAPATVRWISYGPSDLSGDPTTYVDVRRFHSGYLLSPTRDPDQSTVLATGEMQEISSVLSRLGKGQYSLWPSEESRARDNSLVWFGSTSRYFALCAHSDWRPDAGLSKAIAPAVAEVRATSNGGTGVAQRVLTELHSAPLSIAPGATGSFDLGLYAGPLDPEILGSVQPYAGLGMRQLIVYVLSSCCSFCTFAWLANFLAAFLSMLHDYVVFDWALSIIVLVILVRLLLHPLMKRSQIHMQRFGRKMAELKPEMDALQKRYKDDPKKLQAEQMRLYREKNINPVGCAGGMLPTFLQMPIWIALYAVLFFNWDLRQAPAFFGVFQLFGGWQFLGDLSRPDNFFLLPQPVHLVFFTLTGLNILPILMGVVFWFQQKYMVPPTPNMTPEQMQQQKMMKWMMVLLFPLMLYPAPSGLTLYILTSTCIGIWESRMVKRHIDRHGVADPKQESATGKKKRDWMGRMYEESLERARRKQAEKNKRTFKDRD